MPLPPPVIRMDLSERVFMRGVIGEAAGTRQGVQLDVVYRQRLYFEDVEVGQEWESFGRTVTEADVVHFAGVSGDFNPIHMDHEFAPLHGVSPPHRAWAVSFLHRQRPGRGLPANAHISPP